MLTTNPEHPLAGSDFKRRTLEKGWGNRDIHTDKETEMDLDRPYTEERE
jgi:hypothetical protein